MSSASAALLVPEESDESAPFCRPATPLPRHYASQSLGVVAVLVAVQAIFGGYSIIVKLSMNDEVDALVFSLYRDIGASVVLVGGCILTRELRKVVSLADAITFTSCGVLGVTISQTALVIALQWVPPFNASLLQPSQPVITLLLALLLGMETLDLRSRSGTTVAVLKVLGIGIGCAGATFTVLSAAHSGGSPGHASVPPSPPPSSGSHAHTGGLLLGNAVLVGQCVGGATFQLLNKKLTTKYPSIMVAAVSYCAGTMLLALIVVPLRYSTPAAWVLPPSGCGALAYAIFLASAFNYFGYAWAARRSSASHVTAFFPLQVVFAAVFQVVALHEWPTTSQLWGAAMIVVGLLCVVASSVMTSPPVSGGAAVKPWGAAQ